MIKEKKCKGMGKALGCGCGKLVPANSRKYGLCKPCFDSWFRNWLLTTEEGQKKIKITIPKAKKDIAKKNRLRTKEKKEAIRNKSYFEKQLQTEINAIVRLIDQDKGCISCGHGWESNWTRQKHAGHFYSVGANPSLRFNLLNIYVQCSVCNNWKSGNERNYEKGICLHYCPELLDNIRGLVSKYTEMHLSKEELKDKIKIARYIKKETLAGKDYSREEINNKLGIY